MLNFEHIVDLPMIWGGIICIAILLYVLLDGFDLGIGILFLFAPTDRCRVKMLNSIAPFWDGNETWLVMGGGGLLAAFPLAYSIIMPALYIPLIVMLLCLILRGVAFEFHYKVDPGKSRLLWDICFHIGSVGATFCQGIALGTLIQGLTVTDNAFSGGPFDWATSFSFITGIALLFGYAALGSTWLILKTDAETSTWARKVANYVLAFVGFFMLTVSLTLPAIDGRISELWFSLPNFFYLLPIPILTALCFFNAYRAINQPDKSDRLPFIYIVLLFVLAFVGLLVSLYPWIVPFALTLDEAAASPESLSILLVGTVFLLPVILFYTGYSYYVFRGKTSDEALY